MHGELDGQTVGIVGLGNAGADLALKAKAFHMRVLGLRRRTGMTTPNVDQLFGPDELMELLPECDHVVITTRRDRKSLRPCRLRGDEIHGIHHLYFSWGDHR